MLYLTRIDFVVLLKQENKLEEAPPKNIMTTRRLLELLHMNLFGPNAYKSLGGNSFGLVIVDEDLHGSSFLMINRRSKRSSKISLGRPKTNLK